MRIALLDLPSYTPPYDHALAAALARRGHEVELLTSPFPYGEPPPPDGYARRELVFPLSGRLRARSRVRLAVKALEYLPGVARLRRHLASSSPAVVHAQWLALPRLDVRWLRRLREQRPTVFTAHDLLGRRGPKARERWLEVIRAVDRVVVHSQRGADELVAAGLPRDRIRRIPHPAFDALPAPSAPPQNGSLLFLGLIRSYKGLDDLVRALRDVPEARLVVAGDPLDPVAPAQRLARELGVAPRVEWRLGFLPDSEVARLMASAAAVVLPYRSADSSGVLATALGHGRPAVVSDVGSLGDTVREFGAGLVVPPGDVPALARACATILTDERTRADALRGAEAARAALTWEASGEAHERLYEELVAERRR